MGAIVTFLGVRAGFFPEAPLDPGFLSAEAGLPPDSCFLPPAEPGFCGELEPLLSAPDFVVEFGDRPGLE